MFGPSSADVYTKITSDLFFIKSSAGTGIQEHLLELEKYVRRYLSKIEKDNVRFIRTYVFDVDDIFADNSDNAKFEQEGVIWNRIKDFILNHKKFKAVREKEDERMRRADSNLGKFGKLATQRVCPVCSKLVRPE
jgi:hypothetical protein